MIIITKPNVLNLPVSAQIIVAHARAKALLFEDEPIESFDELNLAEKTN